MFLAGTVLAKACATSLGVLFFRSSDAEPFRCLAPGVPEKRCHLLNKTRGKLEISPTNMWDNVNPGLINPKRP